MSVTDGVRKVRMVPQVEEIRREPHLLVLANLEMLEERCIPVLLKRTVIEVAAQVAEAGRAAIRDRRLALPLG